MSDNDPIRRTMGDYVDVGKGSDDSTPSDTDAIKAEIEQTRAELADTVEQVVAKLDVKANVKAQVSDKAETVKQVVGPYRTQIAAGAAAGLVLLLVVRRIRRRSAS